MKLNVFGRPLEVARENEEWIVYTRSDGKRVRSNHISIPADFNKEEMLIFIGDMFHEGATSENPDVVVLEE